MTQRSTNKLKSNSTTTEIEPPLATVIDSQNNLERNRVKHNNFFRRSQSLVPWQQANQQWSLKSKVTGWAIALSILPVLGIGAVSYLGSQSITQQINQAKSNSPTDLTKAEITLKQYQTSLLWGTGIIAILSGAIAAIISRRLTKPVLSAAEISTVLVNRLSRREEIETQADLGEQDELVALKANINQLQLQLPALLSKQETETERSQILINLTRRMQAALSQEDLLRTTVEEVRKALRIDRVVIFHFDSNWNGLFLEESAAPGLPKILWATVSDPCFQEKYIEQYHQGRVRAINNIYQADLTDCHIGLLERFGVKANLVAPILKNNQLFGLLIGHQCSAPRFWQQAEIDLFAQVGTQLGFALDHTRLVEQIDKRADQAHVVINITRKIRESLNEEDVLKTTVEEIRKAISTDRVMVYGFDADWYGTVIAEAVVPGFPKALRARIKDPCFAEGYVDQYRTGRVQATNDIYKAGLSACHISQLEPFAVKANLVAPILKDDQLFGLLIAHQCSAPRDWQQTEIDLFAQLAMQVGFAFDHARLLEQVEQAYESVESALEQQHLRKGALQSQVSNLLQEHESLVAAFSNQAMSQIDSATDAYSQIQVLANATQEIFLRVQALENQVQQIYAQVEIGQQGMNGILDGISTVETTVAEAVTRLRHFEQPSQTLLSKVNLIAQVASQMKRQTMKVVFEAVRTQETGQDATTTEEVLALAQQLDDEITEIKSLVGEIYLANNELTALMQVGKQQAIAGTQKVAATEQALHQITAMSNQVNVLLGELIQTVNNQVAISTTASQSIREIASTAQQTTTQAVNLAEDLAKLTAIAQEWTEEED